MYSLRALNIALISPQAWGCTDKRSNSTTSMRNLPTSVGMYRGIRHARCPRVKSPHKRGDVPTAFPGFDLNQKISPQAWGCTVDSVCIVGAFRNLPTSVGMYRSRRSCISRCRKSPHKRGDVPNSVIAKLKEVRISPQAWGCTVCQRRRHASGDNLPTSVGMYRRFRH